MVRVPRAAAPLVLGCVLLVGAADARAQSLLGQVVDAASSAPVAGALVRINDATARERLIVASDSAGWFTAPLPPGRYTLTVEHAEYPPLTGESVRLTRNERVTVELRLGPRPIGMAPIHVRGRAPAPMIGPDPFYARMAQQRAIGQGTFITRDDLSRMATIGIHEILNRDPDIMIVRVTNPGEQWRGDPGRHIVMMRRAGRECVPQLYVDGVRIGLSEELQRRDPFLVTDLSMLIDPDAVEGVEIYRSPAETPPALRSTDACGTIVFWTRRQTGNPFSLRRIAIASAWIGVAALLVSR